VFYWKAWSTVVRERFGSREIYSVDDAYPGVWAQYDLPHEDVLEFFEFFQREFEIPPGLLRPYDRVEWLISRVPSRNPIKWLFFDQYTGDKEDALDHAILRRMKRRGDSFDGRQAKTILDLLRLWCGDSVPRG
jgi:hypothetical protein